MSLLSKFGVGASIADFSVKKLFQALIGTATVTALGSTIADAVLLTSRKNAVLAADGAVGVKLPKAKTDMDVEIVNTVAGQDLLVYPFSTDDQINAITAGDPFTLVGGARGQFYCNADGHWYVAASSLTGTATTSSTAELNILDGVTATTAELNMAADNSANVEVVTTTNVITAAESGKTFFLNSATDFVSTLPAPAAGLRFKFVVTTAATTTAHTITTNAGADVIYGAVATADGNASVLGSAEDTISLTKTATGGIVGDTVTLISDGTNWYCDGLVSVAAGITFTAT